MHYYALDLFITEINMRLRSICDCFTGIPISDAGAQVLGVVEAWHAALQDI